MFDWSHFREHCWRCCKTLLSASQACGYHSGSESCHLDLHPQIHCCASIGSCACRIRRRRLFVVSRVPHEQILYLFAFASLLLHLLLVLLFSSRSIGFFTCAPPCLFLSPSHDHPSLPLFLSWFLDTIAAASMEALWVNSATAAKASSACVASPTVSRQLVISRGSIVLVFLPAFLLLLLLLLREILCFCSALMFLLCILIMFLPFWGSCGGTTSIGLEF